MQQHEQFERWERESERIDAMGKVGAAVATAFGGKDGTNFMREIAEEFTGRIKGASDDGAPVSPLAPSPERRAQWDAIIEQGEAMFKDFETLDKTHAWQHIPEPRVVPTDG